MVVLVLNPVGGVAEAFGEGRVGGGGVVDGDTLACVLRASEPAAGALGEGDWVTVLAWWGARRKSVGRNRIVRSGQDVIGRVAVDDVIEETLQKPVDREAVNS